jgi:hypothetical protein
MPAPFASAVTARRCRCATKWVAGRGHGSRARLGQPLERQSQQGVPGEDGDGLSEHLVIGGLSAPEVVIIHGRQIVVDERVAVHQFHRRGGEA